MYDKGLLGRTDNKNSHMEYKIIKEAHHNEFSDMCMLTPLWLARSTGVTGTRNPIDTATTYIEFYIGSNT
jgi:hypothetical protein